MSVVWLMSKGGGDGFDGNAGRIPAMLAGTNHDWSLKSHKGGFN